MTLTPMVSAASGYSPTDLNLNPKGVLNIRICNLFVMPNTEKKILDLLSEQLLSTSQVAEKLGMRREVATGYLEALRDQGKLVMVKVGRSHIYRVRDK